MDINTMSPQFQERLVGLGHFKDHAPPSKKKRLICCGA